MISPKTFLLVLGLSGALPALAQRADYPIQAVPFTKVKLTDNFWQPRLKTNTTVTIPASFQRCEATNRVKNFEMAAAHSGKFATTFPFDDTDIYKTLEGAAYSLSLYPDKELSAYMDALIAKVGAAQEPDGYLYTARTIDPAHPHAWAGQERWEKERELSHELYNSGHLYEAAVAHCQATGKKTLLNIALKNADLVCATFGPGKRAVAPGHEIVEMGLVKLYRVTGKPEYLQTAKFFIDQRGHYPGYDPKSNDVWRNGQYWQDDKPVVAQKEAGGHAVRAEYLYSAMADVAALTGDKQLLAAVDTIWQNMVSKKFYVTGGTGAVPGGERFGRNYELPNATAYNETCASVADIYWNQRMFQLHGEAKYADIMEKVLYNGLLSGVGLDGKSFFYSNAMQIKSSASFPQTEPARAGWFECSCCPTNLARLFPSLPGYVYGQNGRDIYVNLFVSGSTDLAVKNKAVRLTQQNNYPWSGDLKFTVNQASTSDFNLLVRIPGWARNEAMPSDLYTFATPSAEKVVIKVNGKPVDYQLKNGYAVLARKWKKNDVVEVNLPMEVRTVVANPKVQDDAGKVALQRGPVIYCAEWTDNDGKASNIIVPAGTTFTATAKPDVLNGITELTATVPVVKIDAANNSISTVRQTLTAIPYYAWANRGKGEMTVWFPQQVTDVDLVTRKVAEVTQAK
ncbi:glycoside hydrolase family 127 protein [Hymenobacter sp. BT770]|uniref:glycoside hydrolase family 127 protein n=1 Tax=Hymenobacter sp. BT770 TaxID=2886942 RepID=UPI001D0F9B67|nr:glycoside hydrolase family 127 protein [Hymenobacter sp. BT770]MCC3154404.1 glycoside hydrolase family 127 protein [Hymenobacter sp. BT770]MDO3416275.1 glycoside hydrolase family 127 protein [Hymenobacter sp. BT770]